MLDKAAKSTLATTSGWGKKQANQVKSRFQSRLTGGNWFVDEQVNQVRSTFQSELIRVDWFVDE